MKGRLPDVSLLWRNPKLWTSRPDVARKEQGGR